jgi:two-component system sensor histidine kinase/response regulator
MDVQMPEMDGLQATVAIRLGEVQSGEHIPIIAMTAHAMAGDKQRWAERDGYISKPFRVQDLFSAIEEVLSIELPLAKRFVSSFRIARLEMT